MQQSISAGVVVYRLVQGKPEYLLLQHSKGGHWDFPKGKVEQGESVHEAALRELDEEAGISAQILPGFEQSVEYRYVHDGVSVAKTVYFFLGIVDTSKITISSEHSQGDWFLYDDAYAQLTYQTSRNVLRLAHEYLMRM